jgi:hypothetical protein
VTDRADVQLWVDGYERAWRTAGTGDIAGLFADDVTYVPSPWATPVHGLEALARFWESERDGHDEVFTMTSEVVASTGRPQWCGWPWTTAARATAAGVTCGS